MARSTSLGPARQSELTLLQAMAALGPGSPRMADPGGQGRIARTATRVRLGAISLRSSSHFPLRLYSKELNPGCCHRPRQARNESAPSGSMTFANTIGTLRVIRCNAATFLLAEAKMRSGASATSSAAYLSVSAGLPAVERISMRTLRPSAQPNCCSPSRNAGREPGLPGRSRPVT